MFSTIKYALALRFKAIFSITHKINYRLASGTNKSYFLQNIPFNNSDSSENIRLEQYYYSKTQSNYECSNQHKINSLDSPTKIMDMLQSRRIKLSVNEEIKCLLQLKQIGNQLNHIYGLEESKIKLSKRLKEMESEEDILVGSLCQALLGISQTQEQVGKQQQQQNQSLEDWYLWEEICQSVVNNRFQVSSDECYWLVKGLGYYLECKGLLEYQRELVKNSLQILVYPVIAILKNEECKNSKIFSLDEICEIISEFENAQIFSYHLAQTINQFLTGRNGVLVGGKKLSNNGSSEQFFPFQLGYRNENGCQNCSDTSGDHNNVKLLERLICIQNYLCECGVLSQEIKEILDNPGNDFDKLFKNNSSINSTHRHSILLQALRLLKAYRIYGVASDFLTDSIIQTISILNSETQQEYSLSELISIFELSAYLCLSESNVCLEKYIDDLIQTQPVEFNLSELQKTQQLRKYQGTQLNILSSRCVTAMKSSPQETLQFLEFIHSQDIFMFFPEFLDSLPVYFAENATHYDFEELCLIYYLLKKEEQLFITDIHQQNGFLNVLKEYIKIHYSQIVSSSKTRGSIPFTSNFFKILSIIDMGELFSESHFS